MAGVSWFSSCGFIIATNNGIPKIPTFRQIVLRQFPVVDHHSDDRDRQRDEVHQRRRLSLTTPHRTYIIEEEEGQHRCDYIRSQQVHIKHHRVVLLHEHLLLTPRTLPYRGYHVHREETNDVSREERDRHAVPGNGDQRVPLKEDDEEKGENGAAQTEHSEEFFLERREGTRPTQSLCLTRTSWQTLLTA